MSLCDLFELFGNAFTGAITDDVPLNASNVTVDDLVAEDGFEDIQLSFAQMIWARISKPTAVSDSCTVLA